MKYLKCLCVLLLISVFNLAGAQISISPDPDFGVGGTSVMPLPNYNFTVKSIVMSSGKLLAAGTVTNGGDSYIGLSGYNPDGTLDGTIGITGTNNLYDFAVSAYNIDNALDVPSLGGQRTFVVYPNPLADNVNLNLNLSNTDKVYVDLYDNNGRKIANLMRPVLYPKGVATQQLLLPETLSSGTYYLDISNGHYSHVVKIIK